MRLNAIHNVLHLALSTCQGILEMAAYWSTQIRLRQYSIHKCPIVWVNNFWRINSIHIQVSISDLHIPSAVLYFALIFIWQNPMFPAKVQHKLPLFPESRLTAKTIGDCSVLPINSNVSDSQDISKTSLEYLQCVSVLFSILESKPFEGEIIWLTHLFASRPPPQSWAHSRQNKYCVLNEKHALHTWCGLNCVSPEHLIKSQLQEPWNVTLVGNRIAADVISCDEVVLE